MSYLGVIATVVLLLAVSSATHLRHLGMLGRLHGVEVLRMQSSIVVVVSTSTSKSPSSILYPNFYLVGAGRGDAVLLHLLLYVQEALSLGDLHLVLLLLQVQLLHLQLMLLPCQLQLHPQLLRLLPCLLQLELSLQVLLRMTR